MPFAEPVDCLSLCGIVPAWDGAQDAARTVERLFGLRRDAGQADWHRPPRVYLGSSFCPRLVHAVRPQRMEELAEYASWAGIVLTLVLPIATESQLDALLRHVDELLEAAGGAVDELTVNDYGAFMYWGGRIAEAGLPVGLNIGRLLNKDTRDPRDPYYQGIPHEPSLLEEGAWGYGNIARLLETYPVAGIELDPTHEVIDVHALPQGVVPAVYGPLCYMSTGQICEFSGIGRADQEKFRPNAPCTLQCQRTAIRYRGASGVRFSKIGRTVYFDQPNARVRGARSYRRVFAPLEEVLG